MSSQSHPTVWTISPQVSETMGSSERHHADESKKCTALPLVNEVAWSTKSRDAAPSPGLWRASLIFLPPYKFLLLWLSKSHWCRSDSKSRAAKKYFFCLSSPYNSDYSPLVATGIKGGCYTFWDTTLAFSSNVLDCLCSCILPQAFSDMIF